MRACKLTAKHSLQHVEISQRQQSTTTAYIPLLTACGQVIQSVSCTPLHIFLGLADQALKIVEREAADLDNAIKSKNGLASQELAQLFVERDNKTEALLECTARVEESVCQAEEVRVAIESFEEQHKAVLEKRNGRFHVSTTEARQIRRLLRELQQQQHKADTNVKHTNHAKQAAQ